MNIRNFCIISHIDHGKSTLADRFLELTHTIEPRKMRAQFLDSMELERERGITIKMQPVRMVYHPNRSNWLLASGEPAASSQQPAASDSEYILNLIDTPGHIDFSYEVSRALAAVEGAVLLIDATQGVQAQTIATMDLARKQGLIILPAINKIDSPHARSEEVAVEVMDVFGFAREEIFFISAKTGEGVERLLEGVVRKVSPPRISDKKELCALVFDSQVLAHKGIALHVRVFSGRLSKGEEVLFLNQREFAKVIEAGTFSPDLKPIGSLEAGQIGYVITSRKQSVGVGETVTHKVTAGVTPLPGYEKPIPVVFANVFTFVDKEFEDLKKALETLAVSDPAFTFEEVSSSIARGFRCGFAGSLHMEIVLDLLRREHGVDVVVGSPTVAFKIVDSAGNAHIIHDPAAFPDDKKVYIEEQWASLEIFVPQEFLSEVVKLFQEYEGVVGEMHALGAQSAALPRLRIFAELPARRFVQGFFDALKSATKGYGSLSWKLAEFRRADLGRLDVLIAEKRVDAFSRIVPKNKAQFAAQALVEFLRSIFPRELFAVKIQAQFDGRILASRTVSALRKNVAGHLYGGDRTRKMKLWQKQKKGKKKLAAHADISIRPEVFRKAISFKG